MFCKAKEAGEIIDNKQKWKEMWSAISCHGTFTVDEKTPESPTVQGNNRVGSK